MYKRKKLILFSILIVLSLVLTGCSSGGGSNETKINYEDLTVSVEDRNGNLVESEIEVLDNSGKVIDKKIGDVVLFNKLEAKEYIVKAKGLDATVTQEEKIDLSVKQDLSIRLDIESSQQLTKAYFLSEDDNKSIKIPDFKDNESVIMGVSTLHFDSNDKSRTNISVDVDTTSDTQANIVVPANNKNKPYVPITETTNLEKLELNYSRRDFYDKEIFFKNNSLLIEELPDFKSKNYTVGEKKNFYVIDSSDNNERKSVETELIGKSNNSQVFLETTYLTDTYKNTVLNLQDEFDTEKLPILKDFYSNEFDIDNNEKVTIVFADFHDLSSTKTYGYFTVVDFWDDDLAKSKGTRSNEGDIIYINASLLKDDNYIGMLDTLTHEFQHLLWHYNNFKIKKPSGIKYTWINEAMSTYAPQKTEIIDFDYRVLFYLSNLTNDLESREQESLSSLLYWNKSSRLLDYGVSNLFINYLVQQFGEPIISEIYSTPDLPEETIEDFTGMKFEDIYFNFTIANKLYNLNLSDRYSYSQNYSDLLQERSKFFQNYLKNEHSIDIKSLPEHQELSDEATNLFEYSASKYYKIDGTNSDMTINIDSSTDLGRIGVFVYRYTN